MRELSESSAGCTFETAKPEGSGEGVEESDLPCLVFLGIGEAV